MPPPSHEQDGLPDMQQLGMGSYRNYVLQTIWGVPDIAEFIERFGIKTTISPHALGSRIDVPKGVNFKIWLLQQLKRVEIGNNVIPGFVARRVTSRQPCFWVECPTSGFTKPILTVKVKVKGTYPETVDVVYRIKRIFGDVPPELDTLSYGRPVPKRMLYSTWKMNFSLCSPHRRQKYTFRGTSRAEVELNMTEFKPDDQGGDLGLGFYTTEIALALAYAGPKGVLWVFGLPKTAKMQVLRLGLEEWRDLTVGAYPEPKTKYYDAYISCDVVVSPVSYDTGAAHLQGIPPLNDACLEQFCFMSTRAMKCLAENLVALVYLEE